MTDTTVTIDAATRDALLIALANRKAGRRKFTITPEQHALLDALQVALFTAAKGD